MTKLNKTPKNRWVECVTGGCHGLVHARPPAENSLLCSGSPLGIPIKITFLRHEGDLNSSLRGTRKKGGGGEREKRVKSPSLFPFLPILYPFRRLLRRLPLQRTERVYQAVRLYTDP